MDDSDRTAIHEVMEQQSISIAKAGITTQLNARTSIIAAANPVYGRYNKSKSPSINIDLPAALLSRFDLIFILIDEPNKDYDKNLAEHVTSVHASGRGKTNMRSLKPELVRAYIMKCKQYDPIIPDHLTELIVEKYLEKRANFKRNSNSISSELFITPRSLLGIIRLAGALCKFRMSNEVNESDLEEALRLIESSKEAITKNIKESDNNAKRIDPASNIFEIVKKICRENSG